MACRARALRDRRVPRALVGRGSGRPHGGAARDQHGRRHGALHAARPHRGRLGDREGRASPADGRAGGGCRVEARLAGDERAVPDRRRDRALGGGSHPARRDADLRVPRGQSAVRTRRSGTRTARAIAGAPARPRIIRRRRRRCCPCPRGPRPTSTRRTGMRAAPAPTIRITTRARPHRPPTRSPRPRRARVPSRPMPRHSGSRSSRSCSLRRRSSSRCAAAEARRRLSASRDARL